MTDMSYVIRPVQSLSELVEVFDLIGAQLEPARSRANHGLAELVALFPEHRALMILAENDGRIVGGAYAGPQGTMAVALVPEARGQGLGTRLVQRLEEGAAWLGLPALEADHLTDRARDFYLHLGYDGQGTTMRKKLSAAATRRTTFDWRYDLAALRARSQQRAAAVARLRATPLGAVRP
jgi:GNAT superfamily N-acetyltransferase